MISLIRNELSKIFHKKAIYIIVLIMIIILIINAYFTYKYNEEESMEITTDEEISYMEEYLSELNPNNPNEVNEYIDAKTQLDLLNLQKGYDTNSWQSAIIFDEMYDYAYNVNTYKYGPEKDAQKLQEAETQYNQMLAKFDNDDWKYFANEKLKIAQEELDNLKKQKEETQDTAMIQQLETQIETAQNNVDIINLRLDNDISYSSSYKNTAVNDYEQAVINLAEYDDTKEHTYEKQQEHNIMIEQEATSKYIIETGKDVNSENTLSYNIRTLFDEDYGMIIFVVLIGVAIAGTIVSEEFSKGTIKLLLVRPYSRTKILLAKYLASIIVAVLAMVILFVAQFVVGGIIFGFDTLNIPEVVYNFNTGQLQEIGAVTYALIKAVTILPIVILMTTLAFAINTLTTNAPLSIGLSLIGYMNTEVINVIIEQAVSAHKFEFMKYFVTEHWNLSQYLYGGLPSIQGFTMSSSLAICVVYLIIMIIPTFVFFKKRNIKNV